MTGNRKTRRPGRPTKYDPQFCQRVIALGKKGFSKAMIADKLGVVRQTLDNWKDEHPDFLDAMNRAREHSLAWWEAEGQKGIWGKKDGFDANAYRLQMLNRFRGDWDYTERKEHSVVGILGRLDMTRLTDEQLLRLSQGEEPLAVLAGEDSRGC